MSFLLNGVITVLGAVFGMIKLLVLASVILSWVGDRSNQIVAIVHSITEPMYAPFRALTRNIPGPLDLAPMLLLLLILFLESSLMPFLQNLARSGM